MNLRYNRSFYTTSGARQRPGPTRIGMTIILVLALLAGAGFGAQAMLKTVWDRVVDYQTPYAQPLPGGGDIAVEPLSTSVVLFVVDGLRVDTSRQMPNLESLRAAGVSLIARAEQPSLSLPGGAALGTGAPPFIHGVTSNWYEGSIKVDNVFAAAQRAGLATTFIGWDGWDQLFGERITTATAPAGEKGAPGVHDASVRDLAQAHLAAAPDGIPTGLTVVYFAGTDYAGHVHGAVSQEYLAAARAIDDYIGQLLVGLDLTQTTVLVTADHGHIDAGGHGGWEEDAVLVPLVLAGRGVAPPAPGEPGSAGGEWPEVRQIDIAPTVAALLGTEVPAHALGDHLGDWLAGDTAWQAGRAVAAAAARARLSALITGIGAINEPPEGVVGAQNKLAAGDAAGALADADRYLGAERVERSAVRTATQAQRRAGRLPIAIGLALAPLLLLFLMARPPRPWASLLGAALFLAMFYVTYTHIRGLTYSFSSFNHEEQVQAFINVRLWEGAAFMFVSCLLAAIVNRDHEFGVRTSAGLGSIWTAVLGLYAIGVYLSYFLYQHGLSFPDHLPNLRAGFQCLVYLLTAAGASLAAIPATLLAMLGAGLGTARRTTNLKWRYGR